jgi:hypothetical protein
VRRLLVAAALVLAARGALAADDDFEPEEAPQRSIALGPTGTGNAVISGDLGWLRSGFRVDLGVGGGFDLDVRIDSFLLQRGIGGQNAGYAGLRYSPLDGPGLRATVAAEIGIVFVPSLIGTRDNFAVRGELTVGYPVYRFMPYLRASLRGLYFDATTTSGWDHDGEVGGGVERAFGSLLVAAEATSWLQPGVRGLPQWRIRAGWSF